MKKVVLVVDNPKRDLGGMSLLTINLVKLNIEVYLVPMYEQELHIYSINPDLIILNYCRPANSNKIKHYKELGYLVGILDTEGGIRRDDREFYKGIEQSNIEDLIDVYFTWGEVQQKVIENYFQSHSYSTNVICTGSPRYDFLHSSFKTFNSFLDTDDKYILVIASFPLCNPKFSSLNDEAKNMADALGYDILKVKQMQENCLKRMEQYFNLLKNLFLKNPNQKFILRAHPFEDHSIYKKRFELFNNILLNDSGEIFSVLHKAKVVIQINSSTGTEASMINIPVLQPEFLNNKEDEVIQVSRCSYLAKNEDDFFELFKLLTEDKQNNYIKQREKDIKLYTEKLISDYFYKLDGENSYRVAFSIKSFLDTKMVKKRYIYSKVLFCKEYLYLLLKGIIKILLRKKSLNNRKEKLLSTKVISTIKNYLNINKIYINEKSYLFGKIITKRISAEKI